MQDPGAQAVLGWMHDSVLIFLPCCTCVLLCITRALKEFVLGLGPVLIKNNVHDLEAAQAHTCTEAVALIASSSVDDHDDDCSESARGVYD